GFRSNVSNYSVRVSFFGGQSHVDLEPPHRPRRPRHQSVGWSRAGPGSRSGTSRHDRPGVSEREGGVRVHTYLADARGAMVTSHICGGGSGLVVVDGKFRPHAAIELKAYVDSLGKPVQRLIVSHMHPDHWFGIHHFRKMPVHAGPATAKFLAENAAAIVAE